MFSLAFIASYKGSLTRIYYSKPIFFLKMFSLLLKDLNLLLLFVITAAGVVPCGGRKKSPRTSSIVQIIF